VIHTKKGLGYCPLEFTQTHKYLIIILDESFYDTALNALLSPTSTSVSHNVLFASAQFNHLSTID